MDTERVVRHFQSELEQLKTRILEMGGLAEEEVRIAIKGLVERDSALIDQALAGDEPVNALHIEIDNRCFTLLALYQPMAADLRAIVAAVKINTDLERVGDLAVNIAEAAQRYIERPPVKKLIDIPRMAGIAQGMLRDALDAFVKRDIDLAQHVLDEDDKLDDLKTQIFRELLTYMLQDPSTIEPALDLILISRHLERIGDHATNIAEDVIFIVSARDVRHHADLQTGGREAGLPYLPHPPYLPQSTMPPPCVRCAHSAGSSRSTRRGGRSAASGAVCRIWPAGWMAAIRFRGNRSRNRNRRTVKTQT